MIIDLISFSFQRGNLSNANYIIDVRFLNNPFYVDELRDSTGLDSEVIKYFKKDKKTKKFLKELYKWIEYILKANKNSNKEKIIIAIGCTGGQHRSPYVIETLSNHIVKKKLVSEISIYHHELRKYSKPIKFRNSSLRGALATKQSHHRINARRLLRQG